MAAAAAAQAELDKRLCCPVNFEPLTQAVSIIPCMDKVNETVAQALFGNQLNGDFYTNINPSIKCPLCRRSVLGYAIDHHTRDLVNQWLQKNIPTAKAQPKSELSKYPGKLSRFVYQEGNWDQEVDFNTIPSKYMTFKTYPSAHSLIRSLGIYDYGNGEMLISISCDFDEEKQKSKIKQYFAPYDFEVVELGFFILHFNAKTPDQIKKMFSVIFEGNNNIMPEPHYTLLKNFVESL